MDGAQQVDTLPRALERDGAQQDRPLARETLGKGTQGGTKALDRYKGVPPPNTPGVHKGPMRDGQSKDRSKAKGRYGTPSGPSLRSGPPPPYAWVLVIGPPLAKAWFHWGARHCGHKPRRR